MAVTSSNYVFLPWIRQGAASAITQTDRSPDQTGIVSVTAKLRINQEPDEVQQQVRLYGPGDVTAIDPRQVIRAEPPHLATDFEPNYFPAIEFDRPDFPWLFTPGKADEANSLRPWLSLIVVRKQEGITLSGDSSRSLPVLEIRPPAQAYRELPDLSESWAWAHAQVTGRLPDTTSLKGSLAGDPNMTLSRLLCPRRLQQLTQYIACVVPTFELGRKAGMGLPITPDDESVLRLSWDLDVLERAWDSGQPPPSPLHLPVYYHWEFRTGTGRDFETLVRRLTPRDARDMEKVGTRSIDISHPGSGILSPPPAGTTLELEGALRLPGAPVAGWPQGTSQPFKAQLKTILNTPWQAAQVEGGASDPVLAPAIYGSWHAARHQVNDTGLTSWLDELNLDPRHRATASLGTQVVQANQEELVASAWEQFGDLQGVNQLRRQAQLGQSVTTVYYVKHFKRLAPESLVKMFSSAKSRVVLKTPTQDVVATRELLSRSISKSTIPDRAVSGTVRQLTSTRAAISTRFRATGAPPIALLSKLNTYSPAAPSPTAPEDKYGAMSMDRASLNADIDSALKSALRFLGIEDSLGNGPGLNRFKVSREGDASGPLAALLPDSSNSSPVGLADSEDARAFRKAALEHHELISYALQQFSEAHRPPMDIDFVSRAVLESVNPGTTIPARIQASLVLDRGASQTGDPLEPLMNAPEFHQPMYEALRDISQDFLLPGLEHVPADTALLLEPNAQFVESFMVGLNHEMGRELLWRDYPTDQGATYFRKFWDTAEEDESDISNINGWNSQKLGSNVYPHSSKKLVLLLRCELLRKYPNAVVYAVAAEPGANGEFNLSTDPQKQRHPLFRGTLKPDVTFLGFDLTKDQATADPGWFFVIQQQPTEPRFGLDEADGTVPNPPSTWNDLSWRHMAATEEEWNNLSHASVKRMLPEIGGVKWGRNGAHQAFITFQRPVRIAIHAKQMIKS